MRDKIQLSKVSDLIMGQSPDSSFCNQIEEGFPFLQGCGEFGKKYPIVENYCTQPKKISPKKSILISVRAPVGDINIADKDFVIGRGLAGIVAKNIDNDFLFYSILNFKRQLKRVSQGSTFEAITSKELQEFEINSFPLPQQRKISKILSTCDTVIEKTEATINKYQAMKQGLMHDLFTRGIDLKTGKLRPTKEDAPQLYKESKLGWIPKDWEVKELDEIGEFKNGVNKDKDSFGSGTPFINISDAYPEILDTSNLSKVEVNNLEKSIYKLDKGDIIFVRSSVKPSGVGYTTLFEGNKSIIVYCGFMIRFRIKDKANYDPFFYNNYFRYNEFRKYLLRVSTVSANTNVNQENLKKLLSIEPLIDEQKKVNEKLVSISQKLITEQSALSKYQQLKTGLMQDLLSGKVEIKV